MTQHSLIQTYSAINPLLPCQGCSVTFKTALFTLTASPASPSELLIS